MLQPEKMVRRGASSLAFFDSAKLGGWDTLGRIVVFVDPYYNNCKAKRIFTAFQTLEVPTAVAFPDFLEILPFTGSKKAFVFAVFFRT